MYKLIHYQVNGEKNVEVLPSEPSLDKLQTLIGGYVEIFGGVEGDDFYCNEEGMLEGLLDNPFFPGLVGDVVRVKKVNKQEKRIALSKNSWITVMKFPSGLITLDEMDLLKPMEHGKVKIMGEEIDVPRFQKSFGKDYTFSGMNHKADPIPRELEKVKLWADGLGRGPFNQILLNYYDNGHMYIGKHSDDERQLVKNAPIVSISLGSERKFRIRPKKGVKHLFEGKYYDINLRDNDVVIMEGCMQKEFTHEIVKIGGVKGLQTGPRVNITLRQFTE